jgi:tetratricopeptide (TPR) repeat protein
MPVSARARPLLGMLAVASAVLLTGCKSRTDAGAGTGSTPLYDDLGNHHHTITASTEGQKYFDQGLRLVYAFNHDEAIASFREGARRDPNCGMCWWGVALALGPNINLPMDPKVVPDAWDAIQRAAALAPKLTPVERDYISALTHRYTAQPIDNRAQLDSSYARAMEEVVTKHPDDLDAATLYAESLMDLQPWNYWTVGGEPKGAIKEIVATLERVVAKDPNHPGACHYYIHTIEASLEPEKALPCADRLAQLMPGAGHLVHMPAHIYMRVGRYDLAVQHNQHAVVEDVSFIGRRHPTGMYPFIYTTHNYHFLSVALAMQGKADEAIAAARATRKYVPFDVMKQIPPLEYFSPVPYSALARFERWDDILKEPAPPPELPYSVGYYHYVRGLALLATKGRESAKPERDSLAAIQDALPPDQMSNLNSMKRLLTIALHHLDAEIALNQKKTDAAIRQLRQAIAVEDGLTYDEPPAWYLPMRQVLGNAYLAAGRPREAEEAFREDLKRNRENGWSLRGLKAALEKQGRTKDAADVTARLEKAWPQATT